MPKIVSSSAGCSCTNTFNKKMQNLNIKYRFSPEWTHSKKKYFNEPENISYIIREVSQICPIFTYDESKPIGNVIINGELYESPDKKIFYLYKANHTYVLPDGTINVLYEYNNNTPGNDNSVFSPGTILKTTFSTGGSGQYAFSSGRVTLVADDDTFIRKVNFDFTK